jgi:hypothetical protein
MHTHMHAGDQRRVKQCRWDHLDTRRVALKPGKASSILFLSFSLSSPGQALKAEAKATAKATVGEAKRARPQLPFR